MSEDVKQIEIEKENESVNEHGVKIGVDLDFADVLKMQRAIWSQRQEASTSESVEAVAVSKVKAAASKKKQ